MAAQNKTTPSKQVNRTEYGRELMPLTEIRDIVLDVSCGLDALCELLWEANAAKVHAVTVLQLLKPFHDKLSNAANDLNDMRMRDDATS